MYDHQLTESHPAIIWGQTASVSRDITIAVWTPGGRSSCHLAACGVLLCVHSHKCAVSWSRWCRRTGVVILCRWHSSLLGWWWTMCYNFWHPRVVHRSTIYCYCWCCKIWKAINIITITDSRDIGSYGTTDVKLQLHCVNIISVWMDTAREPLQFAGRIYSLLYICKAKSVFST